MKRPIPSSCSRTRNYFVPNLIQVDTLVFFLNSIRFSMDFNKRNNYFGSNRVQNIKTLPYQWYFERA